LAIILLIFWDILPALQDKGVGDGGVEQTSSRVAHDHFPAWNSLRPWLWSVRHSLALFSPALEQISRSRISYFFGSIIAMICPVLAPGWSRQ
jgi:hypothetical protein